MGQARFVHADRLRTRSTRRAHIVPHPPGYATSALANAISFSSTSQPRYCRIALRRRTTHWKYADRDSTVTRSIGQSRGRPAKSTLPVQHLQALLHASGPSHPTRESAYVPLSFTCIHFLCFLRRLARLTQMSRCWAIYCVVTRCSLQLRV